MTMSASLSGSVSGGLSSNVTAALQGAGITGDTLQAAITSLTGLDSSAQSAVLGVGAQLMNPKGISINSVAPLIAAGFAATGVGAPIAAAITLGLPMMEGLANALNPAPKYQWIFRPANYGTVDPKVSAGALLGTKTPYGPTDPKWRTFEEALPKLATMTQLMTQDGADVSLESICPGLGAQWAEAHETLHDTRGLPPAANAFRLTYNAAWRKNYEYVINGHNWVDPYTLLTTLANAWNATHLPTSTYTFTGSGSTYINYLINANYDGDDHPPVAINTGASTAPKPPPVPPPTPAQVQQAVHVHALTLHPQTHQAMQSTAPPIAAMIGPAGVLHSPLGLTFFEKALPYVPLAAGLALTPVMGVLAPVVGGAVSAVWVGFRKHVL